MKMENTKRRVLIVENDTMIRRMYGDLLRNEGYDVVEEATAEEALRRISGGDMFDLVLTDIMMAKMDGWEFLKAIRKDLRLSSLKLPVIVISAHFDSIKLRADAFKRGASSTYTKAEPLSKLVKEVRIHTGRMRSEFDDDTNP